MFKLPQFLKSDTHNVLKMYGSPKKLCTRTVTRSELYIEDLRTLCVIAQNLVPQATWPRNVGNPVCSYPVYNNYTTMLH